MISVILYENLAFRRMTLCCCPQTNSYCSHIIRNSDSGKQTVQVKKVLHEKKSIKTNRNPSPNDSKTELASLLIN